jgi:hypothetical protein
VSLPGLPGVDRPERWWCGFPEGSSRNRTGDGKGSLKPAPDLISGAGSPFSVRFGGMSIELGESALLSAPKDAEPAPGSPEDEEVNRCAARTAIAREARDDVDAEEAEEGWARTDGRVGGVSVVEPYDGGEVEGDIARLD